MNSIWKSSLFAGSLLASSCIGYAAVKAAPPTVQAAVQIVDEPAGGFGSLSPFALQVYYRLMSLHQQHHYQFKATDAQLWKDCLLDSKRTNYGRLCASYFLLDKQPEARDFVKAQLASKNLRHRYNAAEALRMHLTSPNGSDWAAEILIKSLADGSLDGSGVESSPAGSFPDGDGDDIMFTPLDGVCRALGYRKDKRAVLALISVLERQPDIGGAADALGEIGDERGIPILMKVLRDGTGDQEQEVFALARFKHKEAVPILVDRLSKPRPPNDLWWPIATGRFLDALLEIGDERAIHPIEQFLEGEYPPDAKRTARRVLVQLKTKDPVPQLMAMLARETYEPEQGDIIRNLTKYPDRRVVEYLVTVARTSDSAYLRREAIFALKTIGDRKSLLELAALLDHPFPQKLKAEWGWRFPPDFQKYFPETLEECLHEATKQSFGRDKLKWEEWIKQYVRE